MGKREQTTLIPEPSSYPAQPRTVIIPGQRRALRKEVQTSPGPTEILLNICPLLSGPMNSTSQENIHKHKTYLLGPGNHQFHYRVKLHYKVNKSERFEPRRSHKEPMVRLGHEATASNRNDFYQHQIMLRLTFTGRTPKPGLCTSY